MFLISITGSDVTRKKKLEEMGQGFCIKTHLYPLLRKMYLFFLESRTMRIDFSYQVLSSHNYCFHFKSFPGEYTKFIQTEFKRAKNKVIYISELHHSRVFFP